MAFYAVLVLHNLSRLKSLLQKKKKKTLARRNSSSKQVVAFLQAHQIKIN